MAANFPNTSVTWVDKVGLVDKIYASHINQVYAELIAIETALIAGKVGARKISVLASGNYPASPVDGDILIWY